MKPSIPKGTRDFSPTEVANRTYIMNAIKTSFETFGFQPIETPSFENSSTLMGKYGEEGDRLIFKILNSGDFLKKFQDLLIDIIKSAVFYHHEAMVHHNNQKEVGFNIKQYKEGFFSEFNQFVSRISDSLFDDEKISGDNLVEDLWDLILDSTVKNEKSLEEFILSGEEELNIIVSNIFADFYYRINSSYYTSYISEKALRYDLTVPFARYVVQHQNEITFPFKRYQIQPVWRADRPQKGRFREFFQ
ncbi:MAG: histidyl-tRNA synthetase, partial [Polaribacter sp.]